MSLFTSAIVAASIAVPPPIHATTVSADSECSNSGNIRATRNTPAATIVAAWMSALTGVGPSIASGSHTCRGNWPDLPTAPAKIPRQSHVRPTPAIAPTSAA